MDGHVKWPEWLIGIRSIYSKKTFRCFYLFLFVLLVGCGHKAEEQKAEEHKAEEHKTEGHKAGQKEESDARAPSIVVHLRMDLDHELRDEKSPDAMAEKIAEIPKLPGKEKTGEVRVPVVQLQDEDTRYKTDKAYLALRQFAQPVQEDEVKGFEEKKAGDKGEGDTINVREKSLVLAGRGFGIKGGETKENITIDSTRYWEDSLPPAPQKKAPESLDLKEGEIKSKRGLIFHERGGGFFKAEEVEEKEKEKDKKNNLPKVISPPVVEKIPETQFRLSQGKGKEMVLLPKVKEGEIDLLMGNEDVNRKAYGNH